MASTTAIAAGGAPAGAAPGGPPPPVEPLASAAPTPTPARTGKPTTMAALGDSITQATGTGQLAQENPKNSWSTGWEVNSVRARLGITTANARNLSANGARMEHADNQVVTGRDGKTVDATTQYVTIELGGNDLCRDTVAQMTPTATYRTQLRDALTAIRTRAPQALVFVMSVPDIYNLWYIRGAPQNGTYHPEGQSDQASGLNGARFYWDGLTGLGVKFPCQSLLTNPDSYSQADRDRRAAVRQRTMEYNDALEAECGQWLRCRYDGDRLFNLTSNRVTPPNGPLLPQNQWAFTDNDISRNEGIGRYICPVQGVVAGGCGDHFHPSKAGQVKLADSAAAASYQWSDTTAPTAGSTVTTAANPGGTYRRPASVSFTGSDAAGLRGQEVRLHRPDGTVSAWDPSIGVHAPVSLTTNGTWYVEVRSLDVNGNQSASNVRTVVVANAPPSAAGRPTLVGQPGGATATWSAPSDLGGGALTRYELEVLDLASGAATVVTGTTATTASLTTPNAKAVKVRVRAVTDGGAGAWSDWSAAALPPFAQVGELATRTYTDLLGRAPSGPEASALTSAVEGGTAAAEPIGQLIEDGAGAGAIIRLYRAYFLRYPEASGLQYWEQRQRGGLSIAAMSQLFSGTPEFRTLYGQKTNREFVELIYRNVLERDGEEEGVTYWTGELTSGRWSRGRVMTFYSESAENKVLTRPVVVPIATYWGLLRRLPTDAERDAGRAAIEGGGGAEDVVATILASAEWVDHVT